MLVKTNYNMKNLKLFWTLLVPVLFLFNSCKEAPHEEDDDVMEVNMDSVKMKIMAMEAAYADASNRRDAAGVAAYYATDAQSYPPDEPALSGRDAIQANIQKHMDADTLKGTTSLNTTGVWASGIYATETGTWADKDSTGQVVASGNFMTLFELRDGKYIAIRDIWNRDSPKMMPK